MFGKPAWFKKKTIGWGLVPTRWQGWGYTAAWTSIIALPFIALVSRSLVWEALIWMGASIAALVFDVRRVMRAMDGDTDDVFVIDEDETGSRLATRQFDMRLRN